MRSPSCKDSGSQTQHPSKSPGRLVKTDYWSECLEWGTRIFIPNKTTDAAAAAGPEATPGEPSIYRQQLKEYELLQCVRGTEKGQLGGRVMYLSEPLKMVN